MEKKTALYEEHVRLKGKMIPFAGWILPVQYTGLADEHLNCRKNVGLFDVSHMGEFHVSGKSAEPFLQFLLTNDVTKIVVGQAQYTLFCTESGGIVDDLIVYRRGTEKFLLVVNGANVAKDFEHVITVKDRYLSRTSDPEANLKIENRSDDYSQIAVQGPKAAALIRLLTDAPIDKIKHYHFSESTLMNDVPAIIARTGYTGEDGFELYLPNSSAPRVWRTLIEQGSSLGVKPCGLGARDTLRLEMKFPLYGNELTDQTSPLEAGLGWVVKMEKGDFLGKRALEEQKKTGIRRKLVGLSIEDKSIARSHYKVLDESGSRLVGEVTSGTLSPSLNRPIAVAYIESALSANGTPLKVQVRDRCVPARVVPTPFLQKEK